MLTAIDPEVAPSSTGRGVFSPGCGVYPLEGEKGDRQVDDHDAPQTRENRAMFAAVPSMAAGIDAGFADYFDEL